MNRTHFTWSTEDDAGNCPECSGPTVLIMAPACWSVDSQSAEEFARKTGETPNYDPQPDEEITGHWCPQCQALRSLSLNT